MKSYKLKSFVFGKSTLNLPIYGFKAEEFGEKNLNVLLIAGVHGDESEGVVLARALLNKLDQEPIENLNITIVPEFNIEGVLLKTRQNHTGVDLNRNLPTKDWTPDYTKIRYYPGKEAASEPENKALVEWISNNPVNFIFSLHSWKPMLNVNGDCQEEANFLSTKTGYVIKDDIGYPTPGSLGTYTGHERKIPTITYEIQKGIDFAEVLDTHLKPLYECLKLMVEKHNKKS